MSLKSVLNAVFNGLFFKPQRCNELAIEAYKAEMQMMYHY